MSVCPFADQSQRFDRSFPTQVYRGGPSKGVLHTTETGGWPGYASGSMAPHFTVRVYLSERKVVIRQHFDTSRPSRALVDGPNPVQTNNDGTVQVELIGTCDKATANKAGYFYWPEAPAWVLDELAKLMRWIEADRGVKRRSTKRPWLPYPKSYGSANGQRMTIAEWDAFDGWCGHQHVPDGNDHGDPGNLNITYLLEEDVALTDAEIDKIAYKVWSYVYDGRQALSYLVTDDTNSRAARKAAEEGAALAKVVAEKQVSAEEISAALQAVVEDSYTVQGDVKLAPKPKDVA